jgi:hypothetical protein
LAEIDGYWFGRENHVAVDFEILDGGGPDYQGWSIWSPPPAPGPLLLPRINDVALPQQSEQRCAVVCLEFVGLGPFTWHD